MSSRAALSSRAKLLSSRAKLLSSRAKRGICTSVAGNLLFVAALAGCSRGVSVGTASQQAAAPQQPAALNTLTPQEQKDGWKLLFDGKTLNGWRAYQADTLEIRDPQTRTSRKELRLTKVDSIGPSWKVIDGVLTKTRPGDDIITKDKYANFEFAWEWKVTPAGNSGVFIRGNESQSKIYWSTVEYQIADDSLTPDSKNPLTSAGAAYGLYAPPKGVAKFAGNWNSSRIVARGTHVEHWMNGQKTIEYEVGSPDFEAKLAASKFKPYLPNWGHNKSGVIGIQGDHTGTLELRNIKIRVLK